MTENSAAASQPTLDALRDLSQSLLRLHKLLLDMERASYEAAHGSVNSSKLLQLVIEDEHFAWLRRISELIVRIDEFLEGETPLPASGARTLIDYTRDLLKASSTGTPFQVKYEAALQDHDVIFAHREVQEILRRG